MSFLGLNKDMCIFILSKLNFVDLRNVLLINKETSKYNDNVLWFNYSKRLPDFEMMKDCIQRPWKEFSLLLIKYITVGEDYYDEAMKYSAQGGHQDLVEFFIAKGASNWNSGMANAAKGGHRDLVDFFISQGADKWDWGISYASCGNHQELVVFFEEKLKTDRRISGALY